jgi:DNA end-binding protein Ku
MAPPRANWKGYLRLSLVSCPVALYPATSEREKVQLHRINKKTGNRVRMLNVDAESGDVIDREDLGKGYEVAKGQVIPIEDEELDAVALDSKRVIEIDEFVPADEIDALYNVRPYYLAPEGDVGTEAFAVIREAISKQGMVALARVVLTNREHVIALSPRGKGLMGMLLRYPYEIRDEKDYFDDIPEEKISKDMLDLAVHIVKTKSGHFHPDKFEDHYENALRDLIKRKEAGQKIEIPKEREPAKVINLMDALRRSVKAERASAPAPAHRAAAHSSRRAPAKRSSARRKAG